MFEGIKEFWMDKKVKISMVIAGTTFGTILLIALLAYLLGN